MLRRFFVRHETRQDCLVSQIKCGLGAAAALSAVGWLGAAVHAPLLLAPFGATAVLVFGQPASPLAQPANVIGGYVLAGLVTAAAVMTLPPTWWAAGLAVGCAIMLMAALRLTHPPAGAVPLLALGGGNLPPAELLAISIGGAAALILWGALLHRLPPRFEYPRKPA